MIMHRLSETESSRERKRERKKKNTTNAMVMVNDRISSQADRRNVLYAKGITCKLRRKKESSSKAPLGHLVSVHQAHRWHPGPREWRRFRQGFSVVCCASRDPRHIRVLRPNLCPFRDPIPRHCRHSGTNPTRNVQCGVVFARGVWRGHHECREGHRRAVGSPSWRTRTHQGPTRRLNVRHRPGPSGSRVLHSLHYHNGCGEAGSRGVRECVSRDQDHSA